MLYKFSCQNFRNVNIKGLKLSKINLLVGPNNAGKSNFIRALSFCANMVGNDSNGERGFLSEVKRNGWKDMLYDSSTSEEIKMRWGIRLSGKKLCYTLSFTTGEKAKDFRITNESLENAYKPPHESRKYNYFRCNRTPGIGDFSTVVSKGEKNTRKRVHMEQNESVFLQFDRLMIENPDLYTEYMRGEISGLLRDMRRYFERFFSYSSAAFDLQKIRELREPQDDTHRLAKNGENFTNVLKYYLELDSDFKVRYLELMQMLIPGIKDVRIEEGLDRIGVVLFISKRKHNLSEMSDGTLKAMILALLLSLPKNDRISVLAIDEPELNLHLAWQKLIADRILRTASFEQCFISTHSPDFLDEFTEGFLQGDVNVFTYNPVEDIAIRKLNIEELKEIFDQGWKLGDLYRVNDPAVGGWPW